MSPVKILLTSDLHLGIERENPLISRDERLSTFRKIISIAEEHDMLLLAGDFVNMAYIDSGYIDEINDELLKAAEGGIEVYYTPGEAEKDRDGTIPDIISDIRTTFTFTEGKKETSVKSGKGDIFIYGRQRSDARSGENITRNSSAGFHIGLFHTDFSPQSAERNTPGSIDKRDIKKMNLDFFALGKSHGFRLFRFSERILGAYPGSPLPASIDEPGEKFVISFEIEDNRINNFRRIPVNTVTINTHEIDCTPITSEKNLISMIKNIGSRESINRVELTGKRVFAAGPLLSSSLTGYFRGLKIIDRTELDPAAFLEEAASGNGFSALFFRNLSLKIKKSRDNKLNPALMAELFYTADRDEGGVLFCDS